MSKEFTVKLKRKRTTIEETTVKIKTRNKSFARGLGEEKINDPSLEWKKVEDKAVAISSEVVFETVS